MPRTNFPKSVQRKAIERAMGQCQGMLPNGDRCPAPLTPGRFQVDHIVMDAMGGEPVLANAQCLCTDCHKAKSKREEALLAKAIRRSDRHQGVTDPHAKPIPAGRPLPSGRPAQRASSPVSKLAGLPKPSLYTPRNA